MGTVPLGQGPGPHDADLVGEQKRLFLIVSDHQCRHLLLTQNITHLLGQGPAQIQVEAGEGFIQ